MIAPFLAIVPATISWSPKVALVMIVANVIAIAIGKATIKHPNVGAPLPRHPVRRPQPRFAARHHQPGSHPGYWRHSGPGLPRRALSRHQLIQAIFSSASTLALVFCDI